MAEALGGAGLGAVVGELLTAIVNLIEKAIHFKPVLENTKRQLECLSSVIQQLDKLNRDFLDCPENIKNLREVINKGKQLILKCDAVKESRFFKYPKTPFYTKKLRNLDAELETASKRLSLQLNVQQIKILQAMGTTNYANLASPETKPPLQFDHHKHLKEHIKEKDDSNEESEKTSRMIKELGEDRYEKIFHQTFGTVAEEKLKNSFACYLSTSAGPVMGVLYASTAKLAYCSDNPLSYKSEGKTEWSYYKVVIPLQKLKAVNPSTSSVLNNPAEKYIQIISCDNYEFWFMGFFNNYNAAVECLQDFPELGAIMRSV